MKTSRSISNLFIAMAMAAMCAGVKAQSPAPTTSTRLPDPALGISTMALWDTPPQMHSPEDVPTVTVFRPQHGTENGTAVIVAPGGAYTGLAIVLEGRQIADWFTARGVTAFVLRYRLGPDNPYPIPLLDAQRAIRLVRYNAKAYGLDANRIGMIGFSAGGHLAAAAGTLYHDPSSAASDPVDRLSDRPDFLILGYPWLNAMQPNNRGLITYCSVLKRIPADACKADEQAYTPSLHVTNRTPTTFIYSTTDDETVPVEASVDFYQALLRKGVPAELHIFRHGRHGSGLGNGMATLDAWPALLELWLRDQGLLSRAVTASDARN